MPPRQGKVGAVREPPYTPTLSPCRDEYYGDCPVSSKIGTSPRLATVGLESGDPQTRKDRQEERKNNSLHIRANTRPHLHDTTQNLYL
jgi:hypothetical protein